MTSAGSRRGFLAATGGSGLTAGLARPAAAAPRGAAATAADDAFAALRATWRTLTLGEGYSPTAEPFRTKLATLGSQAASFLSAMAPPTGALWPDHGTDPQDASYAYVLMPRASGRRTAERARDRDWLRIIANDSAGQGVRVPSRGFTGAGFWSAGTVGPVTASGPVSVQIRERRDGTAVVSVADPTRTVRGLTLTWRRRVTVVLSTACR
ncbi:polysaccharide lyase beta-sandwich domain-containing protein [Streptomyces sp. NPDC058423]|uniref:polysaccharide lyase beta-sandwich domain-containing protein n=1 Tax=unclassified Streptomyces TaxID=2593676 RepID=UPI00364F6064